MNAVNRILGESWNEQEVTEDEAVEMFNRAMRGIRIAGRTGTPSRNGGYYSLPEFINRRAGYCFEAAQFGFWFFSELKINSVAVHTFLTASLSHEVVKLNSGRLIDYFGSSSRYNVASNRWQTENPLQAIASHYSVLANSASNIFLLENAVLYDKYNLFYLTNLMHAEYSLLSPDYEKIISLGEFLLANIELPNIIQANHLNANRTREKLKTALLVLGTSYYQINDPIKLKNIQDILRQYFNSDQTVKQFLQIQ